MQTDLEKLAERCERHAVFHFDCAAANSGETSVDLLDIERGLNCLDLANRLRAQASLRSKDGE